MKYRFVILLILNVVLCFSQDKSGEIIISCGCLSKKPDTDTINFTFYKSEYRNIARNIMSKYIKANHLSKTENKNKNYKPFLGSIDDLEIVITPIYDFKKNIKDNNFGTNLLYYVDFKTDPYRQSFTVYLKNEKKPIFWVNLSKESYDETMNDSDLENYENRLVIPNNFPLYNYVPDRSYLFKDYFSLQINDEYCVIIDDLPFIVQNNAANGLTLEEFNHYLLSYLELSEQGSGKIETIEDKEYVVKKKIKPVLLKVDIK